VTITESDQETYQSTVTEFQPQITEDACLPTAIKNILDELGERRDISGLSMSQSDVNDLCEYREGFYSHEEIIPEQLTHEVSEYGYEAVEATAPEMDFDRLQSIIDRDDASLPIIELDPEYFLDVDGYRVQEAENMPSHTVIVFQINDEQVLYYDPFESFFERSSGIKEAPCTWPKTEFFELWSGRFEERWTLWLDRSEQQPLPI
jgi:hypothetical protein